MTGTAATAVAQSSANPLRTAGPAGRSAAATASPAIGTAVRSTKRTPDGPAAPKPLPVASKTPTAAAKTPVSVAQLPAGGRPDLAKTPPRPLPSGVTPATYRRRVSRSSTGYQPMPEELPHGSVLNGTVTVQPPSEIIDGGTYYEGDMGPMAGELGGDDCCGSCSGGGCGDCCLIPCPRIPWDDLTVFGGVQGFTGPKNLGEAGSFGFHEGFNWGAPVPCFDCLGMQVGARFTQSNLSGTSFTPETRHQTFLTAGLFRRVDWGLQGGIAFDYLSDDWYTDTELTQFRAELSWVLPCSHELGAWMTASASEDEQATRIFVNQIPVDGTATWEATDMYAFFYRHHFIGWEGANARLFAGFTGESDGFIGSDIQVPLTCDLALQAGFAYLVPEESKGPAGIGNEQESWNVAITLVWYPGCGTATSKSYYAPLFNVADNGSFMVDQRN